MKKRMQASFAIMELTGSPKQAVGQDEKAAPMAFIRRLTGLYMLLLGILVALLPLMLIGYLAFFQDPSLRFEAHLLYEVTSVLVIALGAFVTYVTWRCYLASGEVFLRWLALGFLGFTLIYLPQGLISQLSDDMMSLFVVYGPASRLAMGFCFLVALVRFGVPPDTIDARQRPATWGMTIAIVLAINIGLAALILNPLVKAEIVIEGMEALALVFLLAAIIVITLRHIHVSLMIIYLISIAIFAQASIAFMMSDLWSHLWWLAHATFLSGFFVLSFGVVQAFHTTRSFSTVYSQAEVVEHLREQKVRTEEALEELRTTNIELSQQAATDWLTGVANRRHFIWHAEREIARAKREGTNLSLLCLDLDHFKLVNDVHGHQAGDEVLKCVASTIGKILRPTDLLARVGGEEFQVLLPGADIQQAREVAERGRLALHNLEIKVPDKVVKITVSMGCAQLGQDGSTMDSLIQAGDQRLYDAKEHGRDRVVMGPVLSSDVRDTRSIKSSQQQGA